LSLKCDLTDSLNFDSLFLPVPNFYSYCAKGIWEVAMSNVQAAQLLAVALTEHNSGEAA